MSLAPRRQGPCPRLGYLAGGVPATATISDEQRRSWDQSGYLVLSGFCSDDEIEAVRSCYRRAWETCPRDVIVDNLTTGRRSRMSQLSEDERAMPFFKVNDLYLEYEEVREVVLGERISAILGELLGDAPVLCNTLNLLRSSQQDDHVDSIFMTPRTPHKLVATWIALEDSHPDAGMLRYFAGSHRIPLFEFSDGTRHAIREELPRWEAHYREHVERLGLEPEMFPAKRGDLLIWHGDLLHGGSKVNDPGRTRDSLVSHFYALEDAQAQRMKLNPLNAGYWWERPPQEVPGEVPSSPRAVARALVPKRARRALRRRLKR